jgi:NosR/NirI family transcriptional regulator, nitrous oxide reductase regulator
VAQEVFKYPPPELGPEYVEPPTFFPEHHELLSPLLEAGLLGVAILVAAYLAYRKRSRRGLWWLAAASLFWFGFIREGCVCPVGSTQNVAEALVDSHAVILPATILFFVLPLISTLLWGRAFCASVCPLGAIQELVLLRPTTLPRWLTAGLSLLPHVYLGLAVLFAVTGSGYVICRYDPFVGFFRLGATRDMLVIGGSLLLIAVFVGRPYCRFLCPYGVLLGWFSKLSRTRITISPVGCAQCRLCEDACPYDAITEPNVRAVRSGGLRGRKALVGILAVAPFLIAAMGWAGSLLGPELALGNPRVALAAQVEAEEAGLVRETTDASDVFRASSESTEALLAEARERTDDFILGGWLLGAFIGLMIVFKLIGLSIRRSRIDYEADRGTCFACGRCYEWCPVHLELEKSGTAPEVRP